MAEMEKIQVMFEQIQLQMKSVDDKIGVIMKDMEGVILENNNLKERVVVQEQKIEMLEREIRRKNLVVKGLNENIREEPSVTKEKIVEMVQKLGIEINPETDMDEVRRLGKPTMGKTRPVLLKLTTRGKKMEILKNTNRLKGTDIWVDEDYTREIQEKRRQLLVPLKEARKKGHRAYLRHDRLVIDEGIYEMENGKLRMTGNEGAQKGNKRTVSERSPQGPGLDEQSGKTTKMSKN